MKVRDLITFQARVPFPDISTSSPDQVRDSSVVTRESGELCSRILQRLEWRPDADSRALLFTGPRGVGKTHLLHYLAALAGDPNAEAWSGLSLYLEDGSHPKTPMHSLFVQIPADPEISLEGFLNEQLGDVPSVTDGSVKPGAQSRHLVVFDDVSLRIDRIRDPQQLQSEIQLYRLLAETLLQSGVLVVFVAEDRHLKAGSDGPDGDCSLSGLSTACDFIWLSPNHIAAIISGALAAKSNDQKAEIGRIRDHLRQKLPSFEPDAETFAELYPTHPQLFKAVFQMRAIMPCFSPLKFLQTAIESALDNPAERLVCLDCLFDCADTELRTEHGSLLARYDECREKVVPQLKAEARSRAESLLKAIALSTICDALPSSVESLANSLLLYEQSSFLPGYSATFALLREMEQKAGSYLLGVGENIDRTYRLLEGAHSIHLTASREFLQQEQEFRLRLPSLIYDWVGKNLPGWTPESSPKYRRSSQTITAPLPGNGMKASGLVHFKSVLDPLWSEDDLSLVFEEPHSWVVLFLNPTEHFYELESSITELASHSRRIVIWHPDTPTSAELECLRRCALDSERSFSSAETPGTEEAHKILTDLYVTRGRLITATREWSVGDQVRELSLPECLSYHLSNIAVEGRNGNGPSTLAPGNPAIEPAEAGFWAAMLTGHESGPEADPAQASEWLREWWKTVRDIDSLPVEELPEFMQTARLWNEIRSLQNHLAVLRPAMSSLDRNAISFTEAMVLVRWHFKDPSHLSSWKQSVETVVAALRWAPKFEQAGRYLSLAFPTGQPHLDQLREALLERIDHPHRLMDAAQRAEFERMFDEFRKGYIDLYQSRHEDAVHIAGDSARNEPKVNSTALHNLELLSNLHYIDKGPLNRVRIIGKWLHRRQCALPAGEILQKYPRCYCNFNPSGNTQTSALVEQINSAILDGLGYLRSILRKCSRTIIEEIKYLKVDDNHARQIASLLSRGPMIALKPRSIEILNNVIQKHAAEFITAIRSCDPRRSS